MTTYATEIPIDVSSASDRLECIFLAGDIGEGISSLSGVRQKLLDHLMMKIALFMFRWYVTLCWAITMLTTTQRTILPG